MKTPHPKILPEKKQNSTTEAIPAGESLATFITALGSPCNFIKLEAAPQLVKYHFNLINIDHVRRIKRHLPALSAWLRTKIRQDASNIGHFSLILQRRQRQLVHFSDLLNTETYNKTNPITAILGLSTTNEIITLDFLKSPHVLIAGASGSGKSVLLNTIIASLLFKAVPSRLRLLLIDLKRVELSIYKDLPHLLTPIIDNVDNAINALKYINFIMDNRYKSMTKEGHKNINETKHPHIIVIIDELADFMLSSKSEAEAYLIRLSQLGRAAGIHLILATQRPTVNVISGLIKANMTARVALTTASMRDSINILDYSGAEKLTGLGDALLKLPHKIDLIRFQSAYISDVDIKQIINYYKNNN